mgnify:CR=1 FL=1
MQGYLIAAVLALILSGGGFLYVKNLIDTVDQLKTDKILLEEADKSNKLVIEQLKENTIRQFEANRILEIELQASNDYQEHLLGVLRSHDLTALAKAKPGLIENRMNDGTQKVLDDFESISAKPDGN